MTGLTEGEERPTAYLQFIDGALHQQWEIGEGWSNGQRICVSVRQEWRRVQSVVSSPMSSKDSA